MVWTRMSLGPKDCLWNLQDTTLAGGKLYGVGGTEEPPSH